MNSTTTTTSKIPTKAATRKGGQDKVVEGIKSNLLTHVNQPTKIPKPPTKSDRKPEITPINGNNNVVDVMYSLKAAASQLDISRVLGHQLMKQTAANCFSELFFDEEYVFLPRLIASILVDEMKTTVESLLELTDASHLQMSDIKSALPNGPLAENLQQWYDATKKANLAYLEAIELAENDFNLKSLSFSSKSDDEDTNVPGRPSLERVAKSKSKASSEASNEHAEVETTVTQPDVKTEILLQFATRKSDALEKLNSGLKRIYATYRPNMWQQELNLDVAIMQKYHSRKSGLLPYADTLLKDRYGDLLLKSEISVKLSSEMSQTRIYVNTLMSHPNSIGNDATRWDTFIEADNVTPLEETAQCGYSCTDIGNIILNEFWDRAPQNLDIFKENPSTCEAEFVSIGESVGDVYPGTYEVWVSVYPKCQRYVYLHNKYITLSKRWKRQPKEWVLGSDKINLITVWVHLLEKLADTGVNKDWPTEAQSAWIKMSEDFRAKCDSVAKDLGKSINTLPKVAVAALNHEIRSQTSTFQQAYQSEYLVKTAQIKFVAFQDGANRFFESTSVYGGSDNGISMPLDDDISDITSVNDDYNAKPKTKKTNTPKRRILAPPKHGDGKRVKPTSAKAKANANAGKGSKPTASRSSHGSSGSDRITMVIKNVNPKGISLPINQEAIDGCEHDSKVDVKLLLCFGCMTKGHSAAHCRNTLWAAKTGDIEKYISQKSINFAVNKLGFDKPGFDQASLKQFVNKDKYAKLKGKAPDLSFGRGNWTSEERSRAVTTHNNLSRKASRASRASSASASVADDDELEYNDDEDQVVYDSSDNELADDY